ncbi:MAG TPA: heme-binding protein [Dyella sp.]|uniref:GlcG/HbpS family heme-binding protein n=1 Tax=Dyella sp. TaxID=1869338 RepID=UPI002F959B2F
MTNLVKTLTLADAKAMVAAAEAHATGLAVPYAIAVVDRGGHLLHFSRQPGGAPGCVGLAINKAFTAAMFGKSTEAFATLAQPSGELYGIQQALEGRTVVFGGGVPVLAEGAVIGAVGASAGSVQQDIGVAMAAISASLRDGLVPPNPAPIAKG